MKSLPKVAARRKPGVFTEKRAKTSRASRDPAAKGIPYLRRLRLFVRARALRFAKFGCGEFSSAPHLGAEKSPREPPRSGAWVRENWLR